MTTTAVRLRQYNIGSTLVLEVDGDVDVVNIKDFRQSVLCASDTSNNLVMDLRKVDYIDRTGLEVIITIYSIRARQGKKLAILVESHSQPHEISKVVYLHTLTKVTTKASEVGL
ncbi:MAG: STAS domain-containing protein [Armatimonadota bacterium]|nr:STAS domain-containing protein [bacterium]